MAGKMIPTVTGEIAVQDIGEVLIHEHCFCKGIGNDNFGRWLGFDDCKTIYDIEMATKPVTPDMHAWLTTHVFSNIDNLFRVSYADQLYELKRFKEFGGNTFFDVTPAFGSGEPGRFPEAMARLSRESGVNIVMSTGFNVVVGEMGRYADMTKEQLADLIIDDIVNGDKETGIRPGIIKVIMWDVFDPRSTIYPAACAIAQKETGLPFYIHQDLMSENANVLLDVIEENGADLSKFVLCHCGPLLHRKEYNLSLLRRGIYLAHDECGSEIYDNSREVMYHFPRDIDTVRLIKEYIELGYRDQILIGMDVCFKNHMELYGGAGYGHMVRTYYPFMRKEGIAEEDIRRIAYENPQRLFL